jgi:hypothetical protein
LRRQNIDHVKACRGCRSRMIVGGRLGLQMHIRQHVAWRRLAIETRIGRGDR